MLLATANHKCDQSFLRALCVLLSLSSVLNPHHPSTQKQNPSAPAEGFSGLELLNFSTLELLNSITLSQFATVNSTSTLVPIFVPASGV